MSLMWNVDKQTICCTPHVCQMWTNVILRATSLRKSTVRIPTCDLKKRKWILPTRIGIEKLGPTKHNIIVLGTMSFHGCSMVVLQKKRLLVLRIGRLRRFHFLKNHLYNKLINELFIYNYDDLNRYSIRDPALTVRLLFLFLSFVAPAPYL